jgi:DNA-binding response OmpR family regulator
MAGERILIVDDNPMNAKLARILLSAEGFEVRTAADAEQAEFILQEFHPGLILMDIQLPGIDGLALTRRLRADRMHRDVVILALTAYAMEGDEKKARDAGCNGYITKPIDTLTLPDVLRSYLKQPNADPGVVGGDTNDLLTGLRNEFLVEGVENSARLADTDDPQWRREEAERRLHRWASVGETLSFPHISRKAREIEDLLRESPSAKVLAPHFTELARMFSDSLLMKGNDRLLPKGVVALLAGKRFGLVGFEKLEAGRISRAVANAEAIALSADGEVRNPEFLRSLDMIVVNVGQESDVRSWTDSDILSGNSTAVLFVGPGKQLLHNPLGLWQQAHDFVMAPWDPEEIILRAYSLLSRTTRIPTGRLTRTGAKSCVVVADDDPSMTKLISTTLERFGVECHIASDGSEALTLTRRLKPDAVVLDVRMPVLDGFDVLSSIRRNTRTSAVPVLMVTACRQDEDVMRGFGFGADDYVIKPFNPVELAARVTRLLPKH